MAERVYKVIALKVIALGGSSTESWDL